jgi:hypothetical protein
MTNKEARFARLLVCVSVSVSYLHSTTPHLFHDKQLAGDRRVETEEICQQANILFAQVKRYKKLQRK